MKQNADFQEGISQDQGTAEPRPTPKLLTTNESIQIRYSNTLNSAHFGGHNFPHYSKSALFEVTVM